MTAGRDFDDFAASLQRVGDIVEVSDATLGTIAAAVDRIESMPEVTGEALANLVRQDPESIRVLGLAVGLGQEQLHAVLHQKVGTASYRIAARRSADVVDALNELGLVDRITRDRRRTYRYGDLLNERYGSRARAGRAIGRGRALEDAVESIVVGLGLPHAMRTHFVGTGGRTGPCDLAIPSGQRAAQIVVGIKGFNSTGSKLTDARREVEEMAAIRLPRQYVFAVVDGLGWGRRMADLRRIWLLVEQHVVDGIYSQATLDRFREDVADAARRLGIEGV